MLVTLSTFKQRMQCHTSKGKQHTISKLHNDYRSFVMNKSFIYKLYAIWLTTVRLFTGDSSNTLHSTKLQVPTRIPPSIMTTYM